MDDHIYVLDNLHIRQLDLNLLIWAFTSLPIDLWQPLTWLSLAFDYHFWGLNPFGYHLTNILLHALNTALVLLIAASIIKKIPTLKERLGGETFVYPLTLLLAGLFFGIHPLRVESVVWITERKDVLNGLFTFTSILFYLKHAESGSRFPCRNYLLALLFFALSLLAKPVSVVLPLIFLVLDWYPLSRWQRGNLQRTVLEKVPFLLLSVVISAVTLYVASKNQILRPYDFLSPWQRLTVSGNAIFEYCRLLLLPLGISPLKLLPSPLPLAYTVKSLAVLGGAGAVIAGWEKKWLPVTAACFLFPLLPVLAIFQNGEQAFAARYTYLPSLAVSVVAAALLGVAYRKLQELAVRLLPGTLVFLVAFYLLFFAVMTYQLTKVWDDAESYWTRVITVDPIAKPYFERGEYYAKVGRFSEAVMDYSKAIETADGNLSRYIYNLYAIRGEAFRSLGRYEDAVRDFSTAIEMSPHRSYYFCRGQAQQQLGRGRDAAADYLIAGAASGSIGYWYTDPSSAEIQKRLEKYPDDADALVARAVSAVRVRAYAGAFPDFDRAIALKSDRDAYYWNRSTLFLETGQEERALADCSSAIRLNPRHQDAYLRRAALYADKGENLLAIDDLTAVIALNNSGFEGFANRGLILYRLGRTDEAIKDFDTALAINPESAETWYNRGAARTAAGETGLADEDFRKARELGYK